MLSVGLAMDATAVAAARGPAVPVVRLRHAGLVALFFGGFHALMPLLGWFLSRWIGPWVARFGPWIIFGLLAVLGAKMLREAWSGGDDDDAASAVDPFGLLLNAPLTLCLATIGVTTAALSALGLYAGRSFGVLVGRRLDAHGGFMLIGLGTRILVGHLLS